MDRCINANDWVRKENELAVSLNKQIIPVNPDSTFDGTPEDKNFPDIVRHTITSIQHSEISFGQAFNATVDLMLNNRVKPHVRKRLRLSWRLIAIILLVVSLISGWRWKEKSQQRDEIKKILISLAQTESTEFLNKDQFSDSIKSTNSYAKFIENSKDYVKGYFANCMNETINENQEIDFFFKKFRTPYIRDYIIRYIYINLTKNENSETLSHDQLAIIEKNTIEICDKLPIGIRDDQSYPIMSDKTEFESFLNKVIETVPCKDKVESTEKNIKRIKSDLISFNSELKKGINRYYYILTEIGSLPSESKKIINEIIEK